MMSRRVLVALVTACGLALSGLVPSAATSGTLSGQVVSQTNQPIANVVIVATQGGTEIARTSSAADGTYSLSVAPGAYSLRFTPPTRTHSSLLAFGVTAPRTTPLIAQLTNPQPGRVFFSGTVALSSGEVLAGDTTVHFAGRQGSIGRTGTFRFTPTAGTSAVISLKGATNGSFAFQIAGTQSFTMTQDTLASFVVPVSTQRIRVMTDAGVPIVGAVVEGGHGSWGSSAVTVPGPDGLGAFTGTWRNRAVTDAQGWVSVTALSSTGAVPAGFRVTAPSGVPYLAQSFQQATGNGDITLTMNQRVASFSGTVRDQSGSPLAGAFVGYGSVNATTNATGSFFRQIPSAVSGNFEVGYSIGSERTSGLRLTISPFGVPARPLNPSVSHDLTVSLDTIAVRVVDSAGTPVANASVLVTDQDGYAPRGTYRLIRDLPGFRATFQSNGVTNSQGIVQLRTLRLDQELLGVVQVRPQANSMYSPATERVMVGAGAAITVTLPRPTVSVTGSLTTSDGTALTGSVLEFRDGQGNGGSSSLAANGAFGMRVPVGTRGQWSLSCGTTLARDLTVPLCVHFTGMLTTISAATQQSFVLPMAASTFTVVDPAGAPIPNVDIRVSAGHDIVQCRPLARLTANAAPTQMLVLARGTTGSTGVAQLNMVRLDTPCKAEVTLTPSTDSRYQDRVVYLTVGAAADNVIVLSIPAPELNSAEWLSTSRTTVRLTGENLLGLIEVKVDGVAAPGFRVINDTTADVTVPTGFTTGVITVRNGGGEDSIAIN